MLAKDSTCAVLYAVISSDSRDHSDCTLRYYEGRKESERYAKFMNDWEHDLFPTISHWVKCIPTVNANPMIDVVPYTREKQE